MKHNDGIIKFHEKKFAQGACSHCSEETLVWPLKEVMLVNGKIAGTGIKPSTKLIIFEAHAHDPGYKLIKQIGIGCGCYGKFHRQIAHISDRTTKR